MRFRAKLLLEFVNTSPRKSSTIRIRFVLFAGFILIGQFSPCSFADRFERSVPFGKLVETIKHRLLNDFGRFKDAVGNEFFLNVLDKIFHRVQVRTVWWQMKKPNINRNQRFLGILPTRAVQDDQCVNAVRKLCNFLLQVKVHLFGVRLVANMVDDAVGVWAKGTEQVTVSILLILCHRRSDTLLGADATQRRTLSKPRLVLKKYPPRSGSRQSGKMFDADSLKASRNCCCVSKSALL